MGAVFQTEWAWSRLSCFVTKGGTKTHSLDLNIPAMPQDQQVNLDLQIRRS